MKSHLWSIAIGVGMIVVGGVLWLTTQDVHTPVITLSKAGLVVAVLGLVDVVISGVALALPPARRK